MDYDIVSVDSPYSKFEDYDFKVKFKDWTEKSYEVKHDLRAQETWNFVIEHSNKWEPSWIYISTADYIVYRIIDKWYVEEREKLIERIKKCKKRDVKWWDWRRSWLYVISIKELPNLFDIVIEDD